MDSLSKCPWCDIEAATSVPLFQVALIGSLQTGFTIADFWGKVTSVQNPGPAPVLPPVEGRTVTLSAAAQELQQANWGTRVTSELFALIGRTSRITSLKKDIEQKATNARDRWHNLQNNWATHTSGKDFDDLLAQLTQLRSQYEGIPQKRLQALNQLESNRYKLQLHAHLDRCRISHARIKGIGDARKATLQSYGIETAADISEQRILAVPGFGPVALHNLKQWRDQQERRFRFDPNKGVDQAAKNAVERQILTEKIDLERKLQQGLSKLTVSSHHILTRRRALLTQAEQNAADLAQAEADLRAASVILPIASRKGLIAVLGAVSIGGLIIAANQSNGPTPPSSIPQQVQPSAAIPIPPARTKWVQHVEFDANGRAQPEDGYDWLDLNHVSVRWMQGKVSRKYPHVIASDTEGKWEPDDGYDWINPGNLNDKSVRWAPGIPSTHYPHVVAGVIEGQWRPADGYAWAVNPHRLGDMGVILVNTPLDQNIGSSASSFDQGLADRAEFEQWFASLSGDFRRGADWWAGHRSRLPHAGACNGPAAAMNQQFMFGCEAAKTRLISKDIKRKSGPDYRRGWNSYTTGSSPPVPESHAPTQGVPAESQATDADLVKRLNEQELRQIMGH